MIRKDHARVWQLAGPLILSNTSVAILGLVDTAVIGHLEHAYYLGAVAVAAIIFNFLYWGMAFLRMGTTGIVAQIHGRGKMDDIRISIAHAGLVGIFLAVLILLFQDLIGSFGVNVVGGTAEVQHYARVYFDTAIWGAPAVLVSFSLLGWLLGMQNARATLYVSLLVNVLNIILDFVFVFGLDMGVKGVALASVISQYAGIVLAVYLCRKMLKEYPGHWDLKKILNPGMLYTFVRFNRDILIRTLCLIFVFAFFTHQGAKQGDVMLAANAVLLNFQTLLALSLDGFANAAEAMVGSAVGKRDIKQLKQSIYITSLWAIIIAFVYMLFFLLAGKVLIFTLTDLAEVRSTALIFLPWLVISPLISVWCFQLDGIFIGATRGREMRNMMIVSTFVVFLPTWFFLQGFGNHGLWLALMIFFIARALTLAYAWLLLEKEGGFIGI